MSQVIYGDHISKDRFAFENIGEQCVPGRQGLLEHGIGRQFHIQVKRRSGDLCNRPNHLFDLSGNDSNLNAAFFIGGDGRGIDLLIARFTHLQPLR